jgi:hypothetical protein
MPLFCKEESSHEQSNTQLRHVAQITPDSTLHVIAATSLQAQWRLIPMKVGVNCIGFQERTSDRTHQVSRALSL